MRVTVAAVVGKASLGDKFLFGYTQVHPVCFRIIINALCESNIQRRSWGSARPDPTLDFMGGVDFA